MPNVTVSSLKKENDSLKAQIVTLRHKFEILQQSIQRSDGATSNGGETSPSVAVAEASNSLEFYSQSYDDLNKFRLDADKSLKQLWSRLEALTGQVEDIAKSIDQLQRYSYQYNVKIIGLPQIDAHESASDTTTLCLGLFKAVGVEISNHDVDIAHRIPTRNATSGLKPVICKFTRRIVKEQVMNVRKDACKVTATFIGLPTKALWKT